MAKLPKNIIYKFYGLGIPKDRAVKFLGVYNLRYSDSVEGGKYIIHLSGHKKRFAGSLLLRLAIWLQSFTSIRNRLLTVVEEAAD